MGKTPKFQVFTIAEYEAAVARGEIEPTAPRRSRLYESMRTLASDFPNVPPRLIELMAIGEIVEDVLGVSDADTVLELAADAEVGQAFLRRQAKTARDRAAAKANDNEPRNTAILKLADGYRRTTSMSERKICEAVAVRMRLSVKAVRGIIRRRKQGDQERLDR